MNRSIVLTLAAASLAAGGLVTASFAQQSRAGKVPTNVMKVEAKDTNRMPWDIFPVEQINAKIPVKFLQDDPATGMMVLLVKYQAGFNNPWHTHPHAHGMYVLEGVLTTHDGEYGPGSWVWFPEGGWIEHGASVKGDLTFLFVTNKKFGISYESDKDHPYPFHKK